VNTLGPATAWGSIVYAGDAVHPDSRRRVHVLGFQTRVINDFHRANAIVLPVPSAGPLKASNLVELPLGTLEDMAALLRRMDPLRGFVKPDTRSLPRGAFQVVFTRPERAVHAIDALPSHLQPAIDRKLFARLAGRYPGMQLALCCWTGSLHAAPVVLWYEPLDPRALFLPMPVGGGYTLIIGSSVRPFGIRASERSPDSGGLLPTAVWGKVVKDGTAIDYDVGTAQLQQLANVAGKHDLHPRLDPKLWEIRFAPRSV
jgi:hypothetical protein